MTMIQIPLVKSKSNIEIDSDRIPQDMFEYIFALGLKEVLNKRGRSKLKAEDYAKDSDLDRKVAEENIEAIYSSSIKRTGVKTAKAKKTQHTTEALRIAKDAAKSMLKANGLKISHYPASELTKLAQHLFDQDPEIYLAQARENLAKAEEVKAKGKRMTAAEIASIIAADENKVAAMEAKKAKAKEAAPAAAKPKPKPQAQNVRGVRH